VCCGVFEGSNLERRMLAAEPFDRDAKEIAVGCQLGNQGGQLLTPFHRELVDGVRVNDAHRRVAPER
jgi:hypothetical protein